MLGSSTQFLRSVAMLVALGSALIAQAGDAERAVRVVVEVQSGSGGQAVVVASPFGRGPSNSYAVREEVNRHDAVERFALLLPGGPLIVEAEMTIGGEPFRIRREALIDDMLTHADTDGDGETSWAEALESVRFTYGRVRLQNQQQKDQYVKAYDSNQDGLVDRAEARRFLAQLFGGPAFIVTGGTGGGNVFMINNGAYRLAGNGGAPSDLRGLLDVDGDGVLSVEEIARAPERLKSRDIDDNDLLYANEVSGTATTGSRTYQLRVRSGRSQPQPQQAIVLGPALDSESLFQQIWQHYRTDGEVPAKTFSAVPELFNELDADADGLLSADEVAGLNTIEPHLRLAVDLGHEAGGLAVVSAVDSLQKIVFSDEPVSVERPGATVTFAADATPPAGNNFDTTAKQYLDRFDNDDNEYLEESELSGNISRQFAMWDIDGDGKVFAKEIAESLERMQAPQRSQVRASVSRSGDPLFPALDLSGDSRLSLREMKTAPAQLAALDKNGDGNVTAGETPVNYRVTIAIANTAARYVQRRRPNAADSNLTVGEASGPAWFVRMDRNRDGDVTIREFLGTRSQFEELDTNGDGFLEPAEAVAASRSEDTAD